MADFSAESGPTTSDRPNNLRRPLDPVDRAILRVAVWELLHADDVPEPVAVDEAVELAKQLSTDESPGFVNGVLGQVMLVTPQIRAAAEAVRGAVRGTSEGS